MGGQGREGGEVREGRRGGMQGRRGGAEVGEVI